MTILIMSYLLRYGPKPWTEDWRMAWKECVKKRQGNTWVLQIKIFCNIFEYGWMIKIYFIGEPQILLVLKFITKFIDDNPLCCCSQEISTIKRNLLNDRDVIKLKQKSSSVALNLNESPYYFNCNLIIPHDYPESAVK